MNEIPCIINYFHNLISNSALNHPSSYCLLSNSFLTALQKQQQQHFAQISIKELSFLAKFVKTICSDDGECHAPVASVTCSRALFYIIIIIVQSFAVIKLHQETVGWMDGGMAVWWDGWMDGWLACLSFVRWSQRLLLVSCLTFGCWWRKLQLYTFNLRKKKL